jgi:hypothetical protein
VCVFETLLIEIYHLPIVDVFLNEWEFGGFVNSHKIQIASVVLCKAPTVKSGQESSVLARVVVAFQNNTIQTYLLERTGVKGSYDFKSVATLESHGHPTDVRAICLSRDDMLMATTCRYDSHACSFGSLQSFPLVQQLAHRLCIVLMIYETIHHVG